MYIQIDFVNTIIYPKSYYMYVWWKANSPPFQISNNEYRICLIRGHSQIVAAVNFEAMSLHVAAIIDTGIYGSSAFERLSHGRVRVCAGENNFWWQTKIVELAGVLVGLINASLEL